MKQTRIHWSAAALLVLMSGCATVDPVSTKLQSADHRHHLGDCRRFHGNADSGRTGTWIARIAPSIASWGISQFASRRIGAA